MFNNIYEGRRVFVTGHTGFKGAWLSLWLKKLGANVFGYSLAPNTEPSLYNILNHSNGCFENILDDEILKKSIQNFQPEIIFHFAAQPLVRLSYSEPVLTYKTNVLGTLNLLEAARECNSVKAFVNITTDKCYENKEENYAYKEDDPMGGYDMYSSSKGCVELMTSSYRRSFLLEKGYALATARAGNVIGGGDWAMDRLIPDCIKSINAEIPIEIRNPIAIRPWQFVLEPLCGYLILGQKLLESGKVYAQGFNFGPNEDSILTVQEVAQMVCDRYKKGQVVVGEQSPLHEANLLMLNNKKAKSVLGWTPKLTAIEAINDTVDWYKNFYNGTDMLSYSIEQIAKYESRLVD